MNTSFKANATQHKAFIATVKSQFPAINLTGLSLELHCSDYKYNWAINDVITFFTETGKYFVVKASDLLVSVDEATLIQAPERNSIGSLTKEHDYIPPTGYHSAYSSEENQYVHWEKDDSSDEMNGDDWQPTYLDYPSEDIPDDLSIQSQDLVDSPDDACDTNNDDDSHLFYADNTVLVSADELQPTDSELNDLFLTSSLEVKQNEDALQAAKILFHYWALSGNSYPVPLYWERLAEFIESIGAKTDFNTYTCPAREEGIYTTELVIDDKRFFLWENTVVSQDLFFEMLDNQAVNYGVQSWFTQKDISVYQQNYQAIVADCEAIIALYEQATENDNNGIGKYIVFPLDAIDLHYLVEYLNGTEAADEVVNSIKDEEYLFFQVLSTMNFINSTASTVEA